MLPSEFQNQVKKGLSGGFLFYGEEEYTKHHALKSARNSILGDGELATFNHTKINGQTDNFVRELINSLGSLPFMAEKKLTELHSVDFTKLKQSALDDLIEVLKTLSDYPESVIIIYCTAAEFDGGTQKAPSKILSELSKYLTPVTFERETPPKLAKWIAKHFQAHGVFASNEVCFALIEYCGTDMYLLQNEVTKLAAYTKSKNQTQVDESDIKTVCSFVRTSGAFDFTNAILQGNVDTATALLSEMQKRKEKPEFILSAIIDTLNGMYLTKRLAESGKTKAEIAKLTKIHEFRVGLFLNATWNIKADNLKDIISLCLDTDKKIKLSSLDDFTLLFRLIIEIGGAVSGKIKNPVSYSR